jgi:ribonucleoside-diphosphate reductase alpha chain
MVQKHIDHSISVTVNVPEETTVETVSSIYEAGWKYGCKGITIYRAGSRDGVLISDKTPKKTEASVIKRGKFLDADIVRFNNNKEKWIAFVGIKDGNPYEVFTGKIDEDTMNIPTSVKHGVITKVKLEDGTSRYDFTYTDKQGYKTTLDGISRIFDSVYWNYARLISGVLRHGMPVADVVDLVWSMHFDSDSISTWKFGVVKALKSYIKNGTVAGKKHKCDNCGSTNLIYQEGCLLCKDCGIPKCGS